MTLTQLVSDAYLAYRGKLSNVPASGDKYDRIVQIANRKQREWAQDSNIDWPSRYEQRSLGTTTLNTQTYDVDDDVLRPSDYVLLGTTKVTIVKPQAVSQYTSGCYLYGTNPKQLTFITTISSSLAGKALVLPCFTMPTDMSVGTSIVSVDNPQWLVYAVAAELARNDYSKEEQYGNLVGQANDLYQKMLDDAQLNSFLQPNGVANNMPQAAGMGWNL